MTEIVYGVTEIASRLDVSKPTLCNWMVRYSDTPEPDYITPDGRKFWAGTEKWEEWQRQRFGVQTERKRARAEKLRAQLAELERQLTMKEEEEK